MDMKFRECREEKGLSAQVAATDIGVSIGTLLKWESGKTRPDADKVLALCALYGTDPNHLLGFD